MADEGAKKRLLTGLQPSGDLHIGNYFGALKPFLDTYEEFESFLMVADYHALTSQRDPEQLRKSSEQIVGDYLAMGVDPEKAIIFKQSDVAEHHELAWVFECLVTVPFLQQAHSYKDKVAKGLEANAGLFNYPMLMAADILLYNADFVPVGADQRQHIEYTREAASKFNNAYGETFVAPQEKILDSVGTIPGVDGQKMSKSYKNTIPLFGTEEDIRKAVMSIVTDSEGDRPENVYAIHRLYKDESELNNIYNDNRGRYGDLKNLLADDICSFMKPYQEKRAELYENPDRVKQVLDEGAEKAKSIAKETMRTVREKIGIN